MAEDKMRIQVSVAPSLMEKVDRYCAETGLTRSSVFCTAVAEKFYAQEHALDALSPAAVELLSRLGGLGDVFDSNQFA